MSTQAERSRFLESMVVSSSGWRGVFAAGEEDSSPHLAAEKREVAAAAVYAIAETLMRRRPEGAVILATDSRPTGSAIARVAAELFLARGIEVRYLGISPTPEVLAYAAAAPRCAGFIIITASHNPIGHNGFKFGFSDGRVAPGAAAAGAGERFRELLSSEEAYAPVADLIAGPPPIEAILERRQHCKREAESAYRATVIETILRTTPENQREARLEELRRSLDSEPLGIVADFNGSARAASIDRSFLESLGLKVEAINDAPGEIAHQIVPEGEGLAACKEALTSAYRRDSSFRLGYTADNDGDRGNLVFIDPESGTAHELHAQEVFALSMVAELSWYDLVGPREMPPAVVVNGPTSLRVEEIASLWGARVFRSEVGEANVVDRAAEVEGRYLAILGEGSNGGNITPPSQVRDPLSTLGAMVKLARSEAYYRWFDLRELERPAQRDLMRLVRSLPPYTTTGAYESRAILQIATEEHGRLKARYESLLPEAWKRISPRLRESLGITSYRILNYEGTRITEGPGNRGEAQNGGFKVELLDDSERPRGFVWMRGSKTEKAFRVMADIASSDGELEAQLLHWHTALVEEADRSAAH